MRTQKLIKSGLVKRAKGRFSLTNFGIVVYHAQTIMEAGVSNYWKLKAIDSIQDSGQIVENERIKLIQTILDGSTIENSADSRSGPIDVESVIGRPFYVFKSKGGFKHIPSASLGIRQEVS